MEHLFKGFWVAAGVSYILSFAGRVRVGVLLRAALLLLLAVLGRGGGRVLLQHGVHRVRHGHLHLLQQPPGHAGHGQAAGARGLARTMHQGYVLPVQFVGQRAARLPALLVVVRVVAPLAVEVLTFLSFTQNI